MLWELSAILFQSNLTVMFKKFLVASCLFVAVGCSTVPITGRRQLSLVSDAEINTLAAQQYREVISQSKLSSNSTQTAMVRRVGQRIQQAVETYFRQQNAQDQLSGYAWEFNLIQDDAQQNAWAMPGAKRPCIPVYCLLPKTKMVLP